MSEGDWDVRGGAKKNGNCVQDWEEKAKEKGKRECAAHRSPLFCRLARAWPCSWGASPRTGPWAAHTLIYWVTHKNTHYSHILFSCLRSTPFGWGKTLCVCIHSNWDLSLFLRLASSPLLIFFCVGCWNGCCEHAAHPYWTCCVLGHFLPLSPF